MVCADRLEAHCSHNFGGRLSRQHRIYHCLRELRTITDFKKTRASCLILALQLCLSSTSFANSQEFWSTEAPLTAGTESGFGDSFATKEVGSIVHTLESVEALESIPAYRATPKFRQYAKAKLANPGNIWLILRGDTANLSNEVRNFNSNSIQLIDGNGQTIRPDFSALQFTPETMRPKNSKLKPGYREPWILFAQVPRDATGLRLVVDNLHRTERLFALVDMQTDQYPLSGKSGVMAHHILASQRLEVIPAEWTLEEFKKRARTRPARDGFVWLVLDGQTTNTSLDPRQLDSRQLLITDAALGKDYAPVSGLKRYQSSDSMIKRQVMQPGETKHWRLFYQLPAAVQELRFKMGNLSRIEQQKDTIALPDPLTILSDITQ